MYRDTFSLSRSLAAVCVSVAGLFAWPAVASADVTGQATAAAVNVQAVTSLLGTITPAVNVSLASTGTLTGFGDVEQASQLTGSVTSLLSAGVLHATTVSSPETVDSDASASGIGLNLVGNTINAGFVMAQAFAPTNGAAPTGVSDIEGLVINGALIDVTGQPNQTVPILGGQVVLNEQRVDSTGTIVVNAVHVVINGVADVVIASATAGSGGGSSATGTASLPLLMAATSGAPNAILTRNALAGMSGPAFYRRGLIPIAIRSGRFARLA
jgi:hypothetical protein